MTFQEWYATMPKLNDKEIGIARISWNKCKEEALKIITNKLNNIGWTANPEIVEIMRQIENL